MIYRNTKYFSYRSNYMKISVVFFRGIVVLMLVKVQVIKG